MPYLLPTMHERYFFVADVMTLILAFVIPRMWVAAPLFQVGSLLSYLPYFGLSVHAPVYALLPVTLGVSILGLRICAGPRRKRCQYRNRCCFPPAHFGDPTRAPRKQRPNRGVVVTWQAP
jgi:hypothetical protein